MWHYFLSAIDDGIDDQSISIPLPWDVEVDNGAVGVDHGCETSANTATTELTQKRPKAGSTAV